MTEQELTHYFSPLTVPPALLALAAFEREVADRQYFAEGFEITTDAEKHGLRTWSEDSQFLSALWVFAQADGTGSQYAFWVPDGATSLAVAPIVVFGSEGGVHVVAENLAALLQILSFDCEPMVDHDEAYYYRGEGAEPSAMSAAFHAWLKANHGFEVVDDADAIVARAQAAHGARFAEWLGRFYAG